jgi:multicomponent Na+:H+ antiporter subunit F
MSAYLILGGLVVIAIGIVLCLVRAVKGPSLFDRVLAFDCIMLNVVGAVLLLSILFRTDAFMDVVLIVALLGFLGTISFAAYLEGSLAD